MPVAPRYAPLPSGGVLDHTSFAVDYGRAQRARDDAQHARDVWRYPLALAADASAAPRAARGSGSLAGRLGSSLRAPAGRGAAAFFDMARTCELGRVQLAEAMWWLHASMPVRAISCRGASLQLPEPIAYVVLSGAYLGVALVFLGTGAQVGRLPETGVRACLLALSCTSLLYLQHQLPLWVVVPMLVVGPTAALTPDSALPRPS